MSSQKVTIEFTKAYTPYAKGDVAGFSAAEADRFVEAGIAVRRGADPRPQAVEHKAILGPAKTRKTSRTRK